MALDLVKYHISGNAIIVTRNERVFVCATAVSPPTILNIKTVTEIIITVASSDSPRLDAKISPTALR